MVLQIALRKVFSRMITGLEHVADSNSTDSAHHFSSRPDCNSTAEVPSLILRTTLSSTKSLGTVRR